jgi:hypothetical protein
MGLRLALQNFKTYDFDFGKVSNSRTFGFGMITRSSYMYMYTFLDIKFFYRCEVLQQFKLKFMKILNLIKKQNQLPTLKVQHTYLLSFSKTSMFFNLFFKKQNPNLP